MYEIKLSKDAEKFLLKLKNQNLKQKILNKIKVLQKNPLLPNTKKLKVSNKYRLRVGVYRIIFDINQAHSTILIFKIGKRSDVYKNLK